ncbi:MAG TPA: SGNH hydrolase domain-containing protein, partial [Candidatus Sulfotelmatobacter sp.]|nr:SGNH hydrolase domain-containing protein [Candidatus Sulfotelmatobacter sp.]
RDGFAGRFPNVANDLGDLRRVEWSTAQCLKETGLAPMDYCRVASLQPPDVVLIGDSHAAVLYDGLVDGFRKRSQTLMNLGQAGCVPFYDTDTVSPGGRQSDCQPAVNRMMEFATKTASVRTIILSLRGPRYIPGVGFSPSDARAAPKKLLWTGALKNSDQAAVFKAALENTVSRLDATGKRIILVLDWPELGFDPRSCLPRPVSLFSSPKALCGVPRAQVDARNRDYRELASKLEKEFPDESARPSSVPLRSYSLLCNEEWSSPIFG